MCEFTIRKKVMKRAIFLIAALSGGLVSAPGWASRDIDTTWWHNHFCQQHPEGCTQDTSATRFYHYCRQDAEGCIINLNLTYALLSQEGKICNDTPLYGKDLYSMYMGAFSNRETQRAGESVTRYQAVDMLLRHRFHC
jgi:hypothetical protein